MDDRTLFLPLNEGDSESFCPEKEQRRWSSSMVTEDLATDGSWSQSSISRSLQRAETLLRSTFNPSLKWLFHGPSPHEEEEEEEEEGHFVAAHNLTSRSSARLVRLQQALLTMAPQWLLVSGALMGPPQVYVKGLPAEGGVVLLPSSSSLHGNYRALRGLLRQRSLLLFMHEFTRRAHRAAAYISRVNQLLEDHLKESHRTLTQSPSSWSSLRVGLSSLSQELRIHINHWSCLFSKVHSDHHLRSALVQQTRLLMEVKQTLDLLGLQALSLMEQYVFVILSSFTQTKPHCVSRDLLEDILAGTQLYNQAVWERVQYSSSQLRAAGLQQAHYSTLDSSLYPAAFSVRELMMVLALHHANMAAKQLYCWAADHNCHINHEAYASSHSCACPVDRVSCRTSALRSEWTWNQLQQSCCSSPLFSSNQHSPSFYTCPKTPSAAVLDLHLDSTFLVNNHPLFTKLTSVQNGTTGSNNDQSNQCQTVTSQTDSAPPSVDALLSVHPNLEGQINLENCKPLQTNSTPSATTHPLSGLPLSGVCHQDHSSVELLFQSLVSSNDLLSPLGSHIPNKQSQTEQLLPNTITDLVSPHRKPDMMISSTLIRNTPDSEALSQLNTEVNRERHVGGAQQEWTEVTVSSDVQRDRDSERQETVRREGTAVEPDCLHWSPSVWWLDLGQSPVLADLFRQYHSLLWTLCSKALWLQLHVPHTGQSAVSINLQHSSRTLHILHRLRQASNTDAVPKECRFMLEDFSLYLFTMTAHSQWDHVMCRSLGSALKDKCLRDGNRGSSSVTSSSEQDGSVMTSLTMEFFLLLSPPLISCLCCHHSECRASGLLSCWLSLQRHTVNLALATVQMSTIWVMFKAYQFLSSWSLSKFLLITQGDLKVLIESLDRMLHQTKSLMMNSHTDHHATLLNHNHNQFLLSQQLEALDSAMSKLQPEATALFIIHQAFSAVMLKTFSRDCKRMSGEIFEQTMPSAVHWRPSLRTGFPSSPSEYASLAAQTVIGQVLEGVAPLSDDARVQALSVTMTAFMEAWMEHILKQRIKFSVQGALQLKQDFDSIRELIQSDRYGLSAELHQRLLSLRVFQQVDSAVVCLLQQPQAKPYLQPRAWEPFTRCCPANISQDSINAVVGGSITNLRCMEGEDLNQSDPSLVTTDLPQVDPSTPAEPYLAPSLALGNTQQEWLDLRIHSNTRRWRLPGLQCLSKSEP